MRWWLSTAIELDPLGRKLEDTGWRGACATSLLLGWDRGVAVKSLTKVGVGRDAQISVGSCYTGVMACLALHRANASPAAPIRFARFGSAWSTRLRLTRTFPCTVTNSADRPGRAKMAAEYGSPTGVVRGMSILKAARSASLPTSSDPILSSRPSARAPPSVARASA